MGEAPVAWQIGIQAQNRTTSHASSKFRSVFALNTRSQFLRPLPASLWPWAWALSSLHLIGSPKAEVRQDWAVIIRVFRPSTATRDGPLSRPWCPWYPSDRSKTIQHGVMLPPLTESTLLSHRLDHLHPSQQPVEPPLQSLDAQSLRPPHRQPPAHSARSSHPPSSLPPSRPQAYRPRPARHTKPRSRTDASTTAAGVNIDTSTTAQPSPGDASHPNSVRRKFPRSGHREHAHQRSSATPPSPPRLILSPQVWTLDVG